MAALQVIDGGKRSAKSAARQHLADAQAEHKAACDALQTVVDKQAAIRALGGRADKIKADMDAAQAEYVDNLTTWAAAGGDGEAPASPASLATLAKQHADALRQAEASERAAAVLAPEVEKARLAAVQALQDMRARRRDVLAEVVAARVAEYRRAAAVAHGLREHLMGLARIDTALGDEVPGVTDLTMRMSHLIGVHYQLEPGGAERSRQAWRDLVAALAADANAELAQAPGVIDPDERLHKPITGDAA